MYKIPFNYSEVFKRILIIMGVGRSGTTLLGKIMGSMRPTYYVFEPAIMKYLFHPTGVLRDVYPILCEDYFLPIVQGRKIDINSRDDTYHENYWATATEYGIAWRQNNLQRRKDAIEYIKEENPLFIIKVREFHACMDIVKKIFPNVQFLHIMRNPFSVIESAVERDWYSDEYMDNIIDWAEFNAVKMGGEYCRKK